MSRFKSKTPPKCTLLVYIDDATSKLLHLKMVESESTFSYMEATREYIEHHGKPVAFYSDKHTVFRNPKATAKGAGMTHFGRALDALNIETSAPTRRRPRVGSSEPTAHYRIA